MSGKKRTAPEVFLHTNAAVKSDNHDKRRKRTKRTSLILGVNEDIQEFTSAPEGAWISLGKVATDVTMEQIMTHLKKVHKREDFFVKPLTVPEGAKSASFKIGAHFSIMNYLYNVTDELHISDHRSQSFICQKNEQNKEQQKWYYTQSITAGRILSLKKRIAGFNWEDKVKNTTAQQAASEVHIAFMGMVEKCCPVKKRKDQKTEIKAKCSASLVKIKLMISWLQLSVLLKKRDCTTPISV
ncbi:hypothetical protein HHI36_016812 [Cryptolaemus montrouzieri]|uniref:Uncharacterized protein n=1 Tax=Cryptolaemus montrouzieri TaxID=559131 RepID=A0ABD2NL94_9CUCU